MERRDFFKGMAGTAIGVGGFVNSSASQVDSEKRDGRGICDRLPQFCY